MFKGLNFVSRKNNLFENFRKILRYNYIYKKLVLKTILELQIFN